MKRHLDTFSFSPIAPRFFTLVLAITLACTLSCPAIAQTAPTAVEDTATEESVDSLVTEADPPQGYETIDEVKAAIFLGKVKLVDGEIDVPDSVVLEEGIEYGQGGGEPLKLNLYTPKGLDHPVPGLIFIHGGGWSKGSRDDYHYYCVKFAEMGYVVATVSYRLVPEWTFPAAVHDVKCAVRWVRANAEKLHVDPNQIGVVGGSAGGHLSMMIGYSSDVPELEGEGGNPNVSSRVQAVVNIYGPTDLTVDAATGHPTVHGFFGGKKFDEVPDDYEMASPLTHLTADDPPTLILHGTIDELVPIEQADKLAAKLKSLGIPYRYDRMPGWPHTMDLAVVVNERCREVMTKFLSEHLPLPNQDE